jgi:hypothetical protein
MPSIQNIIQVAQVVTIWIVNTITITITIIMIMIIMIIMTIIMGKIIAIKIIVRKNVL